MTHPVPALADPVPRCSSQAETFSAHQHIYEKLKSGDILGNLSRLVSAVRTKAETQLPTYGCVPACDHSQRVLAVLGG